MIFTLLLAGSALSADEKVASNAALGLICPSGAYSYDMWAGEAINDLTYSNIDDFSFEERLSLLADKLPQESAYILAQAADLIEVLADESNFNYVEAIDYQDGELNSAEVYKRGCLVKNIAYVSEKPFKVYILASAWQNMDAPNKILVLGQLLFGVENALLHKYTSHTFYTTRRYFNALFFSDQFLQMTKQELSEISETAHLFFLED